MEFNKFITNKYTSRYLGSYDFKVTTASGDVCIKLEDAEDFAKLVKYYECGDITCINEVVPRVCPIFGRFILRNLSTRDEYSDFSTKAMQFLISVYQLVIKACLPEYSNTELYCLTWVSDYKDIDSIHIGKTLSIIFPKTLCNTQAQKGKLRLTYAKVLKDNISSFNKIFDVKPDIIIENFMDKQVYNNPPNNLWEWPSLKSTILHYKNVDKKCLIKDQTLETLPESDIFNVLTINHMFSFYRTPNRVVGEQIATENTSKVPVPNYVPKLSDRTRETVEMETQQASKLINLVSYKRNKYELGQILFNISEGSNDGKMIWNSWCQQKEDIEEDIDLLWCDFIETGAQIGSLRRIAKEDNPDDYQEVLNEDSYQMLKIAGSWFGGDSDIAKVAKILYGDNYKCISIEGKKTWYRFKNHRWHQDHAGRYLNEILREQIPNLIRNCVSDLNTKIGALSEETDNAKEISEYKGTKKELILYIKKLKGRGKGSIIEEVAHLSYDEDFMDNLDENPNLICFTNGVYDLATHTFRDGKFEDNVSLCTGYDFKDNFTWDSPEVKDVMEYFRKVFTDEGRRRSMLKLIASGLRGGNNEKIIPIFTGVVNNSKSALQRLLTRTFGKLALTGPSTFLTGKSNGSSDVSPDVVRTKGIRFYFIAEATEQEKFNSNKVKTYSSGGDSVYARDLFSNGFEFIPQFMPIVVGNKLPKLETRTDFAMMERFKICWFGSTFDTEAPADPEEQFYQKHFPRDLRFFDRIPRMVQPSMWILIQYYKDYEKEGITDKGIDEDTDKFFERHNPFRLFARKNIKKRESGVIREKILYSKFKEWFSGVYNHGRIPDMNITLEEFGYILKNKKKDEWHGYIIDIDYD